MKPASLGLIKVVYEDLEYLQDSWPNGELKDSEIRRASSTLRRLFTYNDLIKVWVTVVGRKDYLVSGDFIKVIHPHRLSEIPYATSCKAVNPGMMVSNLMISNNPKAKTKPIKICTGNNIPLKKFLNQTAIISKGMKINRNELVQYVANNLGGAHYDDGKQKPKEAALAAMDGFFISDRSSSIHALLSCGQSLAESESTKELIAKIRS